MAAPSVVGTPEVGGRRGNGDFSITPPAGADLWIAYAERSGEAVTMTATNWTPISTNTALMVYLCEGSPGTTWTVAGASSVDEPQRMIIVGYTDAVVGTPAKGTGLTCPTLAVGAETLVVRAVAGFTNSNTDAGYPAAATVARQRTRDYVAGFGVNFFAAVAHTSQATATTMPTAAFTATGLLGADTVTIALNASAPPPPTGGSVTGARRKFAINPGSASGATAYRTRRRRTNLVLPSLTTQTSAPPLLARMSAAAPGGTSFGYRAKGTGVPIHFADQGIRLTHNQFGGRVTAGMSLGATSPGSDPSDHGTGAAALALGSTYGAAKDSSGISIQVRDVSPAPGSPLLATHLTSIADWIEANRPARNVVLCITPSIDGMQEGGTNSPGAQTQLTRLLDAGVHVVISASNLTVDITSRVAEGDPRIIWAGASLPGNDAIAPGSSWGPPNLLFAPVGEPGYTVTQSASQTSDSATKDYGLTSGAAPAIAGVIAAILEGNPYLSPARMQEVLFSLAWRGVVTGVSSGPNHLVNSNANTNDWFIREGLTAGVQDDDGYGDSEAYEYQFAALVGGVWTDWSSSVTATTISATADPGTVTLTGVTPTLTGAGAAVIPVSPAVLSLAGTTPSLAGLSATIPVDPAALTLAGHDAGLTGAAATAVSVDPAALTLTGVTPTTDSTIVIPVDPAMLSLGGLTPSLAGTGVASIAADLALLTLAGAEPALMGAGSAAAAVDIALLALSGQTPSAFGAGAAVLTSDPGILALVGVTPQVDGGPVVVVVDAAVLTLTTSSPTAVGASAATAPVDPATLALLGSDVEPQATATVTVQPALLALTGVDASLGGGAVGVTVASASLTLEGIAVVVLDQTVATVYLGDVPVLVAIGDTLVTFG